MSLSKSDLRITAGFKVGALFFWASTQASFAPLLGLDPTEKKLDRESRPQATGNEPQERPGPDPKRQRPAGNRNRRTRLRRFSLEIQSGSFFLTRSVHASVPGIRASTSWIPCRSRPREILTKHATSDPTTPSPAARHGESWNVMPTVWSWQAGDAHVGAPNRSFSFPREARDLPSSLP